MVEIANIVDDNSLEKWLDRHGSYEVNVTIAHRAAMRVAPLAWHHLTVRSDRADVTLKRFLRRLLISAVAAQGETADITKAAADAVNIFAAAAANTAAVATAVDVDLWGWTRRDCAALNTGEDLTKIALWFGEVTPPDYDWQALKEALPTMPGGEATARGETSVDWSFWIDWYQRALDGTETRWDMLTEIALLDPKIWEGEPSALMDQIYAIWGRHTRGGTPNAEEIKQDPADDLFYSDPLSTLPPDDHGDILDRLKDAVDDVRAIKPKGNYCLATDLADELDKIDEWTARYKDRPLRLYELCIDISLKVKARMDDGALSDKDQDLLAFLRQLERTQLDILNDDEEVARKVRQRGGKRIAKLNDAEKERVRVLTDQAASESKPEFAEELTEKAGVVLDDQANEEDRSDAGYELTSRLSRMKQIKREDVVNAADDAAKVNKGGAAAWDLISTVYSWFV